MLFVMVLEGSESGTWFDCQVRDAQLGRVQCRELKSQGGIGTAVPFLLPVKIAPPGQKEVL